MTKQEFLRELWNRLTELPQEDVEKSLDYYSEMIDDRVEDGLTEGKRCSVCKAVLVEQDVVHAPGHHLWGAPYYRPRRHRMWTREARHGIR